MSILCRIFLLFCLRLCFRLLLRRPPSSPLLPYTTLFRSPPFFRQSAPRLAFAGVQRRSTRERHSQKGDASWLRGDTLGDLHLDRKSTRLNSSHLVISYAVFCLKKKIDHRKIIEAA